MSTIPDDIRAFAEEPEQSVAEPPLPARRIRAPAFTIVLSPTPTQSVVLGVRTSEAALDDTIAQVRYLIRQARYTRTVWNVGPSSRPRDLATLLAARGFIRATRPPFEPEMTAMALVRPPLGPSGNVEARMVRDFDEYVQALRIAMEAFEESEEDAAGWLAAAPALWAQQDGVNRFAHLAFVGGRAVGFAFTVAGPAGLLLGGSGVLAAARGQGAYRALIAARWEGAVKLGKPALVIHAGSMSRPILTRCGFESVARLDIMEDPKVAAG